MIGQRYDISFGMDVPNVDLQVQGDTNVNLEVKENVMTGGTTDYNSLSHKPQINGVALSGNLSMADIEAVYDDTTANWQLQRDFIPRAGAIIIYSDYAEIDGQNIPNIKIGDGLAYLVDLPFVSDDLRETITNHIDNSTVHITAAERRSWDNKVTCYVELIQGQEYKIIFSKD